MMDRDTLIQLVQLRILNRYKLLVDCSGLEDSLLTKLSKRLPKTDVITYAQWCNKVFGRGIRVPVAQPSEKKILGQTHLTTLTHYSGLVQSLRQQDKEHKATVAALEKELARLKAGQNSASVDMQPTEPARPALYLRGWYESVSRDLQSLLPGITNVEGPIFDYHGAANRDYRAKLVNITHAALQALSERGFKVSVDLVDPLAKPPVDPMSTVFEPYPKKQNDRLHELFSFEIRKMPTDILAPTEAVFHHAPLEAPAIDTSETGSKRLCQVSVAGVWDRHEHDSEITHLSFFLHKLFLALAKSADHVPRGVLREKLLLCLMLYWTAPCMPGQAQGRYVAIAKERGYCSTNRTIDGDELNLPAGTIIGTLFNIMETHLPR